MHKIAKGLDYQGRHPESAHAVSEDDSDQRPVPGAGPVVWLVWGVVAVFAVLGAWHLVAGYVQAWGRL